MTTPRFQSYVICTTPRSGSTLLCGLLSATGRAGCPNSHFHAPSLKRWVDAYDIDRTAFATTADTVQAVFGAARSVGSGDTGLFGLRLQRGSFAYLMSQLDVVHPGLPSDHARIEAAFGRTLFLHLSRADKVHQAISQVKATQTGLWHKAADGSELERLSPPKDAEYDAQSIAAALAELTAMDTAWVDWFQREKLEPLTICYEDLADHPSATVAAILEELGLDPDLADGVSPTVSVLADAISHEWAERFRNAP